MLKQNKLLFIAWIFIIGCIMIGGFLGVYIIGLETGEFSYNLAIAVLVGTVSGFLIYLIFSMLAKKKNGNIPAFDERSAKLMQRYLMIVLYVVLVGSGAALIFLYAMGIHFIETGMLIVTLMGLYIVIGIGAFVTKQL